MFKRDDNAEFVEELMENGHPKRYLKGRTLGKGGFAECYEFVSQETGIRYAAKVITKESLSKGKAKQKLQSEIMIHKAMRHRYIVKFEHFFEDHEFVYILLELCSNNTLSELLKRRKVLTEIEVKYYMGQIIQAVKHIHAHKVIHRDLKLGNFFLNDGLEVKVGDFGLATVTHEGERRKTVCGTPNYIAPEILESKKGHSYEVDVWSLGVIAYTLLFGKPPFETNEVKTTYEKIKACDYSFPNSKVSDLAKQFVMKMLKLNPADRATINQLLSDQFLTSEEVPRTLPRSTLACPPSKAYLEQMKNDPKPEEDRRSRHEQFQANLNSSRTSKNSTLKYKCLLADKTQNHGKSRKSERSAGSMSRTTSTANMLSRKKTSHLDEPTATPKVWVSCFEEQPKYGVFYKLNSQHVGMRFNDTTCLVANLRFTKFRYMVLQNGKEIQVENFEAGQEKEYLQKKIKIITHFYKEMKLKEEERTDPKNPLHKLKEDQQPSSVYMTAYFHTTHYTMFSLSNGLYHAKFKDDSDLLIDHQQIVYLSQRKKTVLKIAKMAQANEELKVKYNHVSALIKKIKKLKSSPEDRKEKENPPALTSASHSKLPKAKEMVRRPFSSSSNLQIARKTPEYASNK